MAIPSEPSASAPAPADVSGIQVDSVPAQEGVPERVGLGRIANNSVALIVLDLISKAIPLVTFPWIVRALGPVSYGSVGFAASVAGFFSIVASPGFTTYAWREAAKDASRVNALVRDLVGARIAFASAAYILLVIFAFTLAPREHVTRILILLSGLNF